MQHDGPIEGTNDKGNPIQVWPLVWAIVPHLLCTVMGSGILGLPLAVLGVGPSAVGLAMMVAVSGLLWWTAILLLRTLQVYPTCSTYADLGEAVAGRQGRLLINVMQTSAFLGVATLYLILAGQNLEMVLGWDKSLMTVLGGAAILPFCWLKSLKSLSFLSFMGVLATCVTVVAVVVATTQYRDELLLRRDPNVVGRMFNVGTQARGLATLVFAYGYHTLLPGVMREIPNDLKVRVGSLAVMVTMVVVTFTYLLVVIVSESAFGCQMSQNPSSVWEGPSGNQSCVTPAAGGTAREIPAEFEARRQKAIADIQARNAAKKAAAAAKPEPTKAKAEAD